jgi:hypothetical protein
MAMTKDYDPRRDGPKTPAKQTPAFRPSTMPGNPMPKPGKRVPDFRPPTKNPKPTPLPVKPGSKTMPSPKDAARQRAIMDRLK